MKSDNPPVSHGMSAEVRGCSPQGREDEAEDDVTLALNGVALRKPVLGDHMPEMTGGCAGALGRRSNTPP